MPLKTPLKNNTIKIRGMENEVGGLITNPQNKS